MKAGYKIGQVLIARDTSYIDKEGNRKGLPRKVEVVKCYCNKKKKKFGYNVKEKVKGSKEVFFYESEIEKYFDVYIGDRKSLKKEKSKPKQKHSWSCVKKKEEFNASPVNKYAFVCRKKMIYLKRVVNYVLYIKEKNVWGIKIIRYVVIIALLQRLQGISTMICKV